MKPSRTRAVILALLCGTSCSYADYLIMKDGSRVEGTILQESPEAVRMRYRLTPKIWDEKNFMRTDIANVVKQAPQEVEILELRKVLPTEDLLSADKYEEIIQNRLRPFVHKYPGTPEAKEVEEKIISVLQEEKSKVVGGQAKLEGKWLTADEAKAEQFNIEAFRTLVAMRAHTAAEKWSEALREYDVFLKKGPALRATRYYPEIAEQALIALDKRTAILTAMATEQPALKKQRDEGLKNLESTERARAKEAIDKETAQYRAEAQTNRTNRIRWTDPNKYDGPGIQAALKESINEQQRLQAVDLATVKVQNEALGAVLRKVAEKDYTGGYQAYQQVTHLSSNPLYKDVIADLGGRLRTIYDELLTKHRANSSNLTRGTSAIGGQQQTGQDELISRILAETAPGGAPAAAPAQGAAMPAQQGTAPAVGTPGAAPAPAQGTAPAVTPGTAPAPAAPAPATAPRP